MNMFYYVGSVYYLAYGIYYYYIDVCYSAYDCRFRLIFFYFYVPVAVIEKETFSKYSISGLFGHIFDKAENVKGIDMDKYRYTDINNNFIYPAK